MDVPVWVTQVIKDLVQKEGKHYDECVAIGPMIMMKFVCLLTKELNLPTIVSMNPVMVDGTGMCGACRLQVGDEIKFACVAVLRFSYVLLRLRLLSALREQHLLRFFCIRHELLLPV